ncbi:MAG: DUF5655 domain-containing protein [Ilumatobacter sp.]
MATWTCPNCARTFGKRAQGHMCHPGATIDEFLEGTPEFVTQVFRRVHDHLCAVDESEGGDLIVDPLEKKVLFKHGPTFCMLEVKSKWVAVGFSLRRQVASGRLSRKTTEYGGKFFHVVNVSDSSMIDDEFEDWLTEAYHLGQTAAPSSGDPMVPDDVDFEIS